MTGRPIPTQSLFARRVGRRLVTPYGIGIRGRYPSSKTGRLVEYESLGERDAIAVLEASDDVLDYREQPGMHRWWDGTRERAYWPDFHVMTRLGPVVLEIKPFHIARRPRIRLRHRLIRASLTVRGLPFVVWTERKIARPRHAVRLLLDAAERMHR